MLLLLLTGRCYEAENCAILLPLRYTFAWYPFWAKTKLSVSGSKSDHSKGFRPKLRIFHVHVHVHVYTLTSMQVVVVLMCSR